jgi:hypothetical protein
MSEGERREAQCRATAVQAGRTSAETGKQVNSESAAPLAPEPASVTPALAPGEPTPAREQVLSRELSQFLVDLSIALHRYGMYPEGHPALQPALNSLARRAELLFQDRAHIAVGVARDRLVIEGVATDARHPILRGLAERLHRHHLAVLEFGRGLTMEELALVIKAVAEDPDRGSGPLGADTSPREAWPHVRLYSLTLEGVEMVEGAQTGGRQTAVQFAALWVGLARVALERSADSDRGSLVTEPAVVARAIDEHQRVEAYDQVIVGYLLQIAEELRTAGGAEAQELRRRTSQLVSAMQPETLRRLLDMGGDAVQRQLFVSNAATGMAAGAVVDLVKAAAEASSETVSHGLVRLFTKLAAHADCGTESARPLADSALRDQVHSLLEDWNLADPNPTDYNAMLQQMSKAAPVAPHAVRNDALLFDPLRVVHMALELDEDGPGLWRAMDALVEAGKVPELIGVLGQVPDSPLAQRIWAHMSTPAFVQGLLDRGTHDQGLDNLLSYMPTRALVPLIDLLIESPDRHVRRTAFDRLRRVGQAAIPLAVERLNDARWYVVRNLLSLIAQIDPLPTEFDPSPWLDHADTRVRREAIRAAMRVDRLRPRAMAMALADEDPTISALGVNAAVESCPPEVVPRLMALAGQENLNDELRASAVKALIRQAPTPAVLELLLGITGGDATFSLWRALPPTSQTLLTALTGLARHWPQERRAASVLRRAVKSAEPAVRAAAAETQP